MGIDLKIMEAYREAILARCAAKRVYESSDSLQVENARDALVAAEQRLADIKNAVWVMFAQM